MANKDKLQYSTLIKSYPIESRPEDGPLFLHEIEELNNPSSLVLDLGAGHGTFEYRSFPSTIVAIDNDTSICMDPSRRAHLILADAAALPFGLHSFDLVVANFVFEHFSSPDVVLREIQRVLKPGGFMYLSIPNSISWEDRLFRLIWWQCLPPSNVYVPFHIEVDLSEYIMQAHFFCRLASGVYIPGVRSVGKPTEASSLAFLAIFKTPDATIGSKGFRVYLSF